MSFAEAAAMRLATTDMEQEGSLFLSKEEMVHQLATVDVLAMWLPSEDPKRLLLAAHGVGALAACKIACVFFTQLSPGEAAQVAQASFGNDFSVVAAPGVDESFTSLPEVPLSPTAPPLILANLPRARCEEAVRKLQGAAGHSVLYAGVDADETAAISAAAIPGAFLCGNDEAQSAADVVLLSDFTGCLARAKHRCTLAARAPLKFVFMSLLPRCCGEV
eukprot:TRINITY_DN65434_c0_g1_i1.p1 TRINITY_DN65434_c0_g1~~TRINITY_DN65434_c0_g1_i1.p1  ORF type:complete len:219 (-),score=47.70 TRINITY_DN65434_c0_g1_i1:100-756(-)